MTSPCPMCGKPLPDINAAGFSMDQVWLFNGKFYCNEKCAFAASEAARR